ncbi:MAG: UvrD-helicase domain-containing protein [Oscillospiraceae bacterium]|nr:UvrD-helicase domain-containing protein [Oscillospiraceae bacterium]MBQ4539349.1 UvrD-helicase domain-containing protein [Oscillospiraceae bacterium]
MTDTLTKRYIEARRTLIERRFAKMNDMQRKAVVTTEGPLLILAGAGSGKTTVLINRIANILTFGRGYESEQMPSYITEDDIDLIEAAVRSGDAASDDICRLLSDNIPKPWEITAITFTNKAAGELKARLVNMLGESGNDVKASTFHSYCVRILRSEIEHLGYKNGFVIYDSDDSQKIIKSVLKELNLDDKQFPPRSLAAKFGEFKDKLESPEDVAARAQSGGEYNLKKIAVIYGEYQKKLFAANALDFDDIITLTVKLFRQNPEVLKKYQRRCRYVMVDEYQDTNRSQYQLVAMLSGGYGNLCVVGDDDQSIYAFRGATIENILSFEEQFPNAKVIRLEQNYRSTQNILTAANKVIAQNKGRKGKNLWTAAGDGDKIVLHTAYDERDEANAIADAIAKGHRNGRSYTDFAVLYRLNAQSQTVESALVSAGIPYKVVGGTRFFDRKEIKDIIAYLSIIHNPDDTLRLNRIINEPKRSIGAATMQTAEEISQVLGMGLFDVIAHAEDYAPLSKKAKPLMQFASMMQQLMDSASVTPLDELLDELLDETGYRAMLLEEGIQGQTRLENIEELKTTIKRYESETEEPTLGGFLEEVALYTDLDSYDADSDAATLMTLHAAKGLEFPVVFIPGMEEGVFPGVRALGDAAQLEEERRLAYVGITRAKESLTIMHAKRRMLFGQTTYGRVSRFVGDIPTELIKQEGRRPENTASTSSAFGGRAASGGGYSGGYGSFGQSSHSAGSSSFASQSSFSSSAKKPAAAAAKVDFTKGDRVMHRVFGEGVILNATPMGGDCMLEVEFGKVGKKKIMAAFARLEKI